MRLKDGRSWTQASDDRYRGGPDHPFTQAELHRSSRTARSSALPKERIARALDLIEHVDQLKDVRELVAILSPGGTRRSGADD